MKKILSRTVMLVLIGSSLGTGAVFAQGYGWRSIGGTQRDLLTNLF